MTHRDFDAALAEERSERPTFTLAGQQFTCRAKLPWAAMMRWYESPDGSASVSEFFSIALVKADRQRFADLLQDDDPDDDDYAVSIDQVKDLMAWLMETYTGKATGQPDASAPGQPSTGQPSKVINLGQRAG